MPKKPWNQDAAIYSALRRAYRSSPAVNGALSTVKEVYFIPSKKGKQLRRVNFECAHCNNAFSRKMVAVDHIHPVVDPQDANLLPSGKRNWIKQIDRLFVDQNSLQVLCKPCHNKKTKEENRIRRLKRKEKL